MWKGAAFDEKWKCGWFPECNAPCQRPCRNPNHKRKKCAAYGPHELKDCVHGKWGFYYSSEGPPKPCEGFIHQHNPTGCAMVYLLIYNEDKQQILFDLNERGAYKLPQYRRLTYEPDDLHEVATRFLATLLSANDKNVPFPFIPHRFIFTDASVVYPVCVNNEYAAQILPKHERVWFDRQDVEKAMKSVTLVWRQKLYDREESYGYEVINRGAQLGGRPVFPLAALILRWLIPKQGAESVTTSRATSPASFIASSISASVRTGTSGYASATSSVFGCDVLDEPEDHVNFDEFIGRFLPSRDEPSAQLMSNAQKNIIILCYGIKNLDQEIFSAYDIKIIHNPFEFIANTLSIKNKIIYLIISTDKSHAIIPTIDNHYCVEKIYLYQSTKMNTSSTEFVISEKVIGSFSDINEIHRQIVNDIKLTIDRSMNWNRSRDLFTMLHMQQLENQYSVIQVSTDMPYKEHIVIFSCDNNWNITHAYRESSPLYQFSDTTEYLDFINRQTESEIFLIISGSLVPPGIQSTFDHEQIYSIYFFRNYERKYPRNKRKVSGEFDNLENLFKQLHNDIRFYREQSFHTIRIDMFSKVTHKQQLISQLNDKYRTFLACIFFMDILPFVPLVEFTFEDLTRICDNLFPNQGADAAHYLNQLQKENDNAKNFLEDPKFSQIILRIHQLQKLNELFILRKQFVLIQQWLKTPTLHRVYVSRIITNDILKMMQASVNEYISIGMFVLATKSFLTARTIARRMTDNGLISILMDIEIVEGIRWLEIGFDRVIFRPGTVFCLKSIDPAPDDVYYAKLKSIDKEFDFIKEQFQLEIDVKLSWLTYGNYLYFLNRFEEGELYFSYLLDKLSAKPVYLSAIHNNMGLLYAKKYGEEEEHEKERYMNKTIKAYDKVFENIQTIDYSSVIQRNANQSTIEFLRINDTPTPTMIDDSTITGHIADLYYDDKNYDEALKSYTEALELSLDKRMCRYYQQMILRIREHLKEQ